jgi:hypothetical protein
MNRIEIVLAAVLAVIFTLTQCKRDDDISPEDCAQGLQVNSISTNSLYQTYLIMTFS